MGGELKIGFLFDNDGVLMDTQELHWRSWQLLMDEDPAFFIDYPFYLASFGKRNDCILEELYPDMGKDARTQVAQKKEELFRKVAKGAIQLLPGMEAFLRILKAQQIPRIIASSTPISNLEFYLKYTVLGDYFTSFVSGEEVAFGKPAPDIFLEAARRLELKPEESIVIEDAPVGIAAGKKAGSFVIGLATTYPEEDLKEADLILKSPKDLHLENILDSYAKWKSTI